ncbi:MAG: MarR family winged helix-turn-helix transcriptional regulator [Pseudolysinimonas sp.]
MDDDVLRAFTELARTDLGRLLAEASASVNAELMRRLAAGGYEDVRPSQIPVFAGLTPGGTRISSLAQTAGMSRQAMSMLVREVERLGYISTSPDPSDHRGTLVRLTERGVAFCREAMAVSSGLTDDFAGRLGGAGLDELRAQLRRVIGA